MQSLLWPVQEPPLEYVLINSFQTHQQLIWPKKGKTWSQVFGCEILIGTDFYNFLYPFFLSFTFDWEDINTRDFWPHFQTPWKLVRNTLLWRRLNSLPVVWRCGKNNLSCLIGSSVSYVSSFQVCFFAVTHLRDGFLSTISFPLSCCQMSSLKHVCYYKSDWKPAITVNVAVHIIDGFRPPLKLT